MLFLASRKNLEPFVLSIFVIKENLDAYESLTNVQI